jgi:hypothetical protein
MKTLKLSVLSLIIALSVTALFIQATHPAHLQNHTLAKDALETEKESIRKVVDLETSSYYKQDFETWKSTYIDESYFRLYGYWEGFPEKVKAFNGFQSLKESKKKQFEENRTVWQQCRVEKSHENFRIYPEIAWYTFEETSYDATTGKLLGKCAGTRILEKHEGEWKIAYLGFHFFPLEKQQ